MISKREVIQIIGISLVYILLTMVALSPLALARDYERDIYDLWNTISEFEEVSSLRKFLLERYWISEGVEIDKLDYILVLTQQCSEEFFPNVPTSLALAIISVESGFDSTLRGFSNDTGLMQVIPKYHKDRIERYLWDENVTLYDPRLNVMVGMDYLEELLRWSKGDISKAVMAYNMGPVRATYHFNNNYVSGYTRKVLKRMNAIQAFMEGGR